jgi:hypothetical protein
VHAVQLRRSDLRRHRHDLYGHDLLCGPHHGRHHGRLLDDPGGSDAQHRRARRRFGHPLDPLDERRRRLRIGDELGERNGDAGCAGYRLLSKLSDAARRCELGLGLKAQGLRGRNAGALRKVSLLWNLKPQASSPAVSVCPASLSVAQNLPSTLNAAVPGPATTSQCNPVCVACSFFGAVTSSTVATPTPTTPTPRVTIDSVV